MEPTKDPLAKFAQLFSRPVPDAGDSAALQSQPASSALPVVEMTVLPVSLRDDLRFLSTLCTRLWHFERQLERVAQNEPSESHDRLVRRFESVTEALRESDIEILDHDGQPYDSGLTLTVLQYEPREDLKRETIIETVKPSLRVRGILIPGEVIVGQPPVAEAEPVEDAQSAEESR